MSLGGRYCQPDLTPTGDVDVERASAVSPNTPEITIDAAIDVVSARLMGTLRPYQLLREAARIGAALLATGTSALSAVKITWRPRYCQFSLLVCFFFARAESPAYILVAPKDIPDPQRALRGRCICLPDFDFHDDRYPLAHQLSWHWSKKRTPREPASSPAPPYFAPASTYFAAIYLRVSSAGPLVSSSDDALNS